MTSAPRMIANVWTSSHFFFRLAAVAAAAIVQIPPTTVSCFLVIVVSLRGLFIGVDAEQRNGHADVIEDGAHLEVAAETFDVVTQSGQLHVAAVLKS